MRLTTGNPEPIGAILALHEAGVIDVPTELVTAAERADRLEGWYQELQRAGTADQRDPLDTAIRAALEADDLDAIRAAGTIPSGMNAARALAAEQTDVCYRAGSRAALVVHTAVRAHADTIGDSLLSAREKLLDVAAAGARVMGDAGTFSYSDPGALYAADKPVQAAFAALRPLAERHDAIIHTAVLLANASDWDGCAELPDVMVDAGTRKWTYRPSGHPVQRLVAASLVNA